MDKQREKEQLVYSCCDQYQNDKLTSADVSTLTRLAQSEVEELMERLKKTGRLPIQYLTQFLN